MFLLAVLAAAAGPQIPARVTVRIVRAERIDKQKWERVDRKREIIRTEDGRPVRIRLIEFQ